MQNSEQEEAVSTDLQIHELLEALRESRLIEELDLSPDRAEIILGKIRYLRDLRKGYVLQRYRIENKLDALLQFPGTHPEQISEVLNTLETIKTQYYQNLTKADQDIQFLLTPEEQARYVLFQRNFNRHLREIIANIREQSKHGLSGQNQLLRKQDDESVIRQSN